MTNEEIRAWYLNEVAKIADLNINWIAAGYGLESRARKAWLIRHNARLQARSMMESPAEVEMLRRRDLQVYGNPDGPTFEQLVAEHARTVEGGTVFERIIEGAKATDQETNERFMPGRPPS